MNDQRAEALRLAKEAGMQPGQWEYESQKLALIALIALARASAAPQEPEPDPSDELAWYKWAHKELGRRNVKLAEENFQYWQKERDAAPIAQTADARDSDLQAWKKVAFRLAEDRLQTGNYNWSPQELLRACLAAASSAQPLRGSHERSSVPVE
jgi:hypothetical protein